MSIRGKQAFSLRQRVHIPDVRANCFHVTDPRPPYTADAFPRGFRSGFRSVFDRIFLSDWVWIGIFLGGCFRRVVKKGSGRMHCGKRFVETGLAGDFTTHKVQVLENISHIMKYHIFRTILQYLYMCCDVGIQCFHHQQVGMPFYACHLRRSWTRYCKFSASLIQKNLNLCPSFSCLIFLSIFFAGREEKVFPKIWWM